VETISILTFKNLKITMGYISNIVVGILSSIITVILIYILTQINFLYLNYYRKIITFKKSYHKFYLLNLNNSDETNINYSKVEKVFYNEKFVEYEYLLSLDDFELYNSLFAFGLIQRDNVHIEIKNRTAHFKKLEEYTNIEGNKIILIYDKEIFSYISMETENTNLVSDVIYTQGIQLNKIPCQCVQYLDVNKLKSFNLLTCVNKWFTYIKSQSELIFASFLFLLLLLPHILNM
jgi:hypothetical protein